MKKPWSDSEVATLRECYPDEKAAVIGERLSRSAKSVVQKANMLGLTKSAEFIASGQGTFLPGHRTWIKGMKGVKIGAAVTHCFKPKPIGSTRLHRDGYVQIKTADPDVWEWQHRLEWEKAHGTVPAGFKLLFKDGNKQNCVLENLELISKQEDMRRKHISQWPTEMQAVIRLNGQLKRILNERQ